MTGRHEDNPDTPHILIVGRSSIFRGRLGQIFTSAGIRSQGVASANSALKKLDEADPPITGVLTDTLEGDYPQVIEAVRQIGVNLVLMTRSSLTISRMRDEGITAYTQDSLIGDNPEPSTIDAMISALVPPPVSILSELQQ